MKVVILKKDYSGEGIIDIEEDISWAMENTDPAIPKDDYNIHKGTFKLLLSWEDD